MARYFEASECGAAAGYYADGEHRGLVSVTRWQAAGGGRAGVVAAAAAGLDRDGYGRWLAGFDPVTGVARGAHRKGSVRESVLAWEHAVTASKTLSVAAALDPQVAEQLGAAFDDATAAVASVVASRGVVRLGPRGRQVQVPVSAIETAQVDHFSSRAGDPHRHRHLQINARVLVEHDDGTVWRAVDSRALLKGLIGEVNEAERAAICGHAGLRRVLAEKGWRLGADGEIAHFAPVAKTLSKRAEQIKNNMARLESSWREAHPGAEPGAALRRAWDQYAWADGREAKDPAATVEVLAGRAQAACAAAGVDWRWGTYGEDLPGRPGPVAAERVAERAVEVLSGRGSAWSAGAVHAAIDEQIRLSGWWGEAGRRQVLHEQAAAIALEGCVSILPGEYAAAALVQSKHLTSGRVLAADTRLHAELARMAAAGGHPAELAETAGLDGQQQTAAALIAGSHALAVVEGVAGGGKTRMLTAAQQALQAQGRRLVVATPTLKAAAVARAEGIEQTFSVHKLLHDHGWRWDHTGRFTRLAPGQVDPANGKVWAGVPAGRRVVAGSVVVVDEAGMLDVDTALALIDLAGEARVQLRLVGDRAQLAAVGRGGVMHTALKYAGPDQQAEITTAHRFRRWDPVRSEWADNRDYANLAARIRLREAPAGTFTAMRDGGSSAIDRAETIEAAYNMLAEHAAGGGLVIAPVNTDVAEINQRTRDLLIGNGQVDDTRVAATGDDSRIGAGDKIVTRRNDPDVGVANREMFTVTEIRDDGSVIARPVEDPGRPVTLPAGYVTGQTGNGMAWVQHAYATTGHGAQGHTVDRAAVLVTGATDAAGLYVGVTRGRLHNSAIIVAADDTEARHIWTTAATKVRADAGIDAARQAAVEEIGHEQGPPTPGPAPLTPEEIAEATGLLETRILPRLKNSQQWADYRRRQDDRQQARQQWVDVHGDPARIRQDAERHTQAADRLEAEAADTRHRRVETVAADTEAVTGQAMRRVADARYRLSTAGIIGRRSAKRDLQQAITEATAIAPDIGPPAEWGYYDSMAGWQQQIIGRATDTAAKTVTSKEHLMHTAAANHRQTAARAAARAEQAETGLAAHLGPEPQRPEDDYGYQRQNHDQLQHTTGQLRGVAEKLDPEQTSPLIVRLTLLQIHTGDRQQAEQQAAQTAARRQTSLDHQNDYLARARRNTPSPGRGPGIGR